MNNEKIVRYSLAPLVLCVAVIATSLDVLGDGCSKLSNLLYDAIHSASEQLDIIFARLER